MRTPVAVVLVSGDEPGVLDRVDNGEIIPRLGLMGSRLGVGGRGLHGLRHILKLEGVGLRHRAGVAPLDHALVVHLEVDDGGVALLVNVGDGVALGRLNLLHVVAPVLGVGERDLALLVGHKLLVEGALVVPDVELRASEHRLVVERVDLQ